MASLDGWNQTSEESLAAYNACVFPGDIDGDDVAASNGLNNEFYSTSNTQAKVTWDFNEDLTLVYIFGFNEISYHRTTDDDNTASLYHDRQFYVNHEADTARTNCKRSTTLMTQCQSRLGSSSTTQLLTREVISTQKLALQECRTPTSATQASRLCWARHQWLPYSARKTCA